MFPHSSGLRITFLVLCETFILVVTFLIAAALRLGGEGFLGYELLVSKALLSAVVLQLCLYMGDLYETFAAPRPLDLLLRLSQAFLVGTLVLALVYLGIPDLLVGRGILLIHLPLAFLATAGWRYLCLVVWGHEALCENLLV
ncbi:MAG TPA: hypothetical protein VIC87_03335, partial [Vicinamibacteria bacterium]